MASVTSSSDLSGVNPVIRLYMINPGDAKGRGDVIGRERELQSAATWHHRIAVASAVALVILAIGTLASIGRYSKHPRIYAALLAVSALVCRNYLKLPLDLYYILQDHSNSLRLEALACKWVPRLVSGPIPLIPSDNEAIKQKLKDLKVPDDCIPEHPSNRSELRTLIALHEFCDTVRKEGVKADPLAIPCNDDSDQNIFCEEPSDDTDSIAQKTAEQKLFRNELAQTIGQFTDLALKTNCLRTYKIFAAFWHALIQRPDCQKSRAELDPKKEIHFFGGNKTIPELAALFVQCIDRKN